LLLLFCAADWDKALRVIPGVAPLRFGWRALRPVTEADIENGSPIDQGRCALSSPPGTDGDSGITITCGWNCLAAAIEVVIADVWAALSTRIALNSSAIRPGMASTRVPTPLIWALKLLIENMPIMRMTPKAPIMTPTAASTSWGTDLNPSKKPSTFVKRSSIIGQLGML